MSRSSSSRSSMRCSGRKSLMSLCQSGHEVRATSTETIDHFSTVVIVEKKPERPNVRLTTVSEDGLDWFNPSVVNGALALLRRQNPHVAGLQCICTSGDHFIPTHCQFLQVLRKRDRYVLVSTYRKKNGHVDFYDPLNNRTVSKNTQNRIANLMIHHNVCPKLFINIVHTNHRLEEQQSGLLCIALILLIIKGITPDDHLLFDADKIKCHIENCMKEGLFTLWFGPEDLMLSTRFNFKPLIFGREKTPANYKQIEIDMHCLCHRPEDDIMIPCLRCQNLYHPVCVMKFGCVKIRRKGSVPSLLCPDCKESPKFHCTISELPRCRPQYDAYIAYSSSDLWFVKTQLIPNLEQNYRNNYRLVVSERDFMPGNDIVDEIIYGVAQSRVCLVVGSTNYFKGQLKWFEWNQIVLHKWFKTKIILIDSFDEVINTSCHYSFNERLMQRNFFEWRSDFTERAYLEFWNQLKQYLHRPRSVTGYS